MKDNTVSKLIQFVRRMLRRMAWHPFKTDRQLGLNRALRHWIRNHTIRSWSDRRGHPHSFIGVPKPTHHTGGHLRYSTICTPVQNQLLHYLFEGQLSTRRTAPSKS